MTRGVVEQFEQRALDLSVWEAEVGFWEWEVATDTLRWLNGWPACNGIHPCDGPGHVVQLLEILDPDHRPRLLEAWDRHRSGGRERYEVEYRVRDVAGEWRWLVQRARIAEFDADGNPVRMIGMSADVDARVRLAERVERSRRTFDVTAASLDGWIFLLDREGRIEFASRPVHGVPPTAVVGRRPADFVQVEEAARFEARFAATVGTRTVQRYTSVVDGGRRVLETRLSPIVVDDELVGVASTVIDVTTRLALERAVLEAGGRERRDVGAALHEGLAQQLAGIAFRLKGLASAAEASGSPLAPDLAEMLQHLKDAIGQARELAQGAAVVAQERGGLRHALRALAHRQSRPGGPDVRVRIAAEVADGLGPLAAEHLYRNADEALANALRHAAPRTVTIALEAAPEPGMLQLVVEDDGRGLDGDAEYGPGLGLKLMRLRTETIGGRLLIEPRPGGGTRVSCVCPSDALPVAAPS